MLVKLNKLPRAEVPAVSDGEMMQDLDLEQVETVKKNVRLLLKLRIQIQCTRLLTIGPPHSN